MTGRSFANMPEILCLTYIRVPTLPIRTPERKRTRSPTHIFHLLMTITSFRYGPSAWATIIPDGSCVRTA